MPPHFGVAPGALRGRFGGLILDMDGVLYRGNEALPGARQLVRALRDASIAFIMLTNNATMTSADFAAKLARMGIPVGVEEILTSAGATALYLGREYPGGGRVMVFGEEGLQKYISEMHGFELVGEMDPGHYTAEFVVVGLDFDFDYEAMKRACRAIRAGARFVATNSDATLPVEGGELWPGAGSIVASIQTCAGVAPTVIGKPNTYMAQMALDKLSCPAERALCVGDRLETDILFGARAGMPTALVLTGVSRPEDLAAAEAQPDYIFDDLYALMRALGIG